MTMPERLTLRDFLADVHCEWNELPSKRRKPSIWLCKACGYMVTRHSKPACKPREIAAKGQA